MFWKLLYRTILFELVKVFAMSLIAIMSILIMAGIVAEASQQGLKPVQILMIIPLLIPSFLPYTIPATTLFAACVVYGRLAHDNEILAIKASGVNILKVVWPGIFLGVVLSGITMGLYYDLIPRTNYLLRAQFLNDVEEFLYDMLKLERCIKRPNLPYVIWVRQVQGTRLLDALFKRLDPKTNSYDIIAKAREAELHVDMAKQQIVVRMYHGQVSKEDGTERLSFEQRDWEVPLPQEMTSEQRPKARALTWPQLLERRVELVTKVAELQAKIDQYQAGSAGDPTYGLIMNHLQGLKHSKELELFSLDNELFMRPVLSCSCLFFVLVGCPVGIWFSRSDYLSAFITCFMPILFVYYPLLLCCTNLVRQGHNGMFLWCANGLMAIWGLLLFRQLLKH